MDAARSHKVTIGFDHFSLQFLAINNSAMPAHTKATYLTQLCDIYDTFGFGQESILDLEALALEVDLEQVSIEESQILEALAKLNEDVTRSLMESLQLCSGADAQEEGFDEDANAAWRDAQLRVLGLVRHLRDGEDAVMAALRDLQAMTGGDAITAGFSSGTPPTAS